MHFRTKDLKNLLRRDEPEFQLAPAPRQEVLGKSIRNSKIKLSGCPQGKLAAC